MKRHTLTAFVLTLACAAPARAQIPVTDIILNATNLANHAATMAKWVNQYNQLRAQIDQAQRAWDASNGSRRLGMILNDPRLRDYLPDEWRELYREARRAGVLSLNGTSRVLYDQNHLIDVCDHLTDNVQRMTCEARSIKGAIDAGLALDSLDSADARIEQIEGLMAEIDKGDNDDPRAIAELQARIGAEQGLLQNEQIKLDLFAAVASAEDRMLAQREHEESYRAIAAPGSVQAVPLTFR